MSNGAAYTSTELGGRAFRVAVLKVCTSLPEAVRASV